MIKLFTGKDLFIGRYKTENKNWIFVFLDTDNHKYEIIVPKEEIEIFMKEYKIKDNIFYKNN